MVAVDYTRRMERLIQICKSLPASLSLEPMLQTMVEAAADLLESEDCSILLYDKEHRCLRFVAAPKNQLDTLKNLGVPVERSVAGWVYAHARAVKLNQADEDERVFRVVDREVSDDTHSLLAVPLTCRGETFGVFEAVNKRNEGYYTEEDLEILETLAAQTAIAIQNQHLVDEAQIGQQSMLEMDQLKSDWIAILSQELRATLGSILTQAALLSKDAAPEQQPGLDQILDGVGRLKEVASQLDALEHLEKALTHLQTAKIQASILVNQVVEAFQGQAAARNIALLVSVPEDLVIECDVAKIAVALRNLVENALLFSFEGGWVRVRIERLPGFTKFAVIDRGVGIPEKERGKIFERFYQVKPQAVRHPGAGLGLSIARQMVEMHGGEIWVESEDGQGSTFSFILPAADSEG